MDAHIQKFLDNNEESVNLPFIPLNDYCEILHKLGFSTKRNNSINLAHDGNSYDTNGWQVDFWWDFYKGEQKYTLAGSLFHGNITLSKNNDDDDGE